MFRRWALIALLSAAAGCDAEQTKPQEEGDPNDPDGGLGLVPIGDDGADAGASSTMLAAGSKAKVTASVLNLRDMAGTLGAILQQMPCGAEVDVLGGPSTTPAGWWNIKYSGMSGWASGTYLVPSASFNPSMCMMSMTPQDGGTVSVDAGSVGVDSVFALAKLAVGYSYYWGHGSWRADGATLGTCTGSCPSCSHNGQYGADCSGFVAKVWQVPSASPIETDAHPYSTYNFYNEETHWKKVPRSTAKPADAFVHRTATAGHIALFESGVDPFGATWLYEARGCATGVVHNLRIADSSYIAIRRDGL